MFARSVNFPTYTLPVRIVWRSNISLVKNKQNPDDDKQGSTEIAFDIPQK